MATCLIQKKKKKMKKKMKKKKPKSLPTPPPSSKHTPSHPHSLQKENDYNWIFLNAAMSPGTSWTGAYSTHFVLFCFFFSLATFVLVSFLSFSFLALILCCLKRRVPSTYKQR